MIAYRSLYAMGTRMELVLPDVEDDLADKIIIDLRSKIQQDESILSIYQQDSVFSNINQHSASKPWKVSSEVFQLFEKLLHYHQLTLGYFDISLGILKKDLFNTDIDILPELLKKEITERIVMDKRNSMIRLSGPHIKIDSGAFGKGYALDSVKKILISYKINNAFISFGDSSIATLGSHPAGDHWKIGIRDLINDQENAYVFKLNNGAVSTSGNTRQNKNKADNGHIINPRTGKLIDLFSVVSVKGPESLEAEILSTALFVAKKEDRKTILDNFPHYKAVELVYSKDDNFTKILELN